MAEVTADWLMSNAHQDGPPGDDALFVTRASCNRRTGSKPSGHDDGQAANEGEPTVTGRIVGGLIKAVKVMVNVVLKA
jgi:hypothetical protein